MKEEMHDLISSLQKSRQKDLLNAFYIYFLLTAANMIVVAFFRENESLRQKLIELGIALLIPSIFSLSVYLTYKKTRGHRAFDRAVIILVMIFSMFSLLFGPNVILSLTSYMPVFLFLVFSTMNTRYLFIYLFFNISVVFYSYFGQGPQAYETSLVNYMAIIMTLLTVLVIASRLIHLYNTYIHNISKDYQELNNKNMELSALNEEYYATQEELYDKVDEITHLNQKNETLAFFDSLTGLPNRMNFIQSLNQIISHKVETAYIIFADIRRFKDINSVYSYLIGDKVLVEVAKRLKALPYRLTSVARMSGDLFAVIIEDRISKDDLIKSLQIINRPLKINEFNINILLNYGILELDDQEYTQTRILQSVDASLNRAKEEANDHYYFFNSALIDEIEKRVSMSNALENAIKNKSITTVFQPVVDSMTGKTLAYETLARWTDPVLGPISPEFFIHQAEQSGLIIPLGELILHQACDFLEKLSAIEARPFVTVNLSSIQLLQDNVVTQLLNIIDDHQIPYSQIGFEVTETDLIRDFDIASYQLQRIKEKGIKIYLDDFGTGYSSLNYLSLLPIDVLKIDRNFISNIHNNPAKQPILRIIIELALQYNLRMVAEGVEIKDEYEYLRTRGVHMIQGYYFSRPLPADRIIN